MPASSGNTPYVLPLPSTAAPRRRTAAPVLGALGGVLAAVAVLPTIVPLTQRIDAAEDRADVERVVSATRAANLVSELEGSLRDGLAATLEVDGIAIVGSLGQVEALDGRVPGGVPLSVMCPPGEAPGRIVLDAGERWAVACLDLGGVHLLSATRATQTSTGGVSLLVLGLAAIVGISTAFGVLQILSPLSKIQVAMERVGTGERGVRVDSTGLGELDALIEQLNRAAQAFEDREDAILGRIAVVQEMARVVAHEIRNPLQSLELLAGLSAAEEDPSERAELASSIQEEVRVLERVVSRMLKAGEGGALRLSRTPTSLRDLVGRIVAFRLPEARHRGVALVQGPVVDRTLEIDRALISRALENLVSNAVEHAPPGSGRVVVSAKEENGFVVLEVDDNGPGVDEALGGAIFHWGVKGRPEGNGVGLALVQGVLSAHGGHVGYGRSPLGGASFQAALPIDPAATAGLADPAAVVHLDLEYPATKEP